MVGAQLNLGSALRGMRRYGEAEQTYRRVLQRDPQSADAYFNLGVLFLDAPELGGLDAAARRSTAIQYLMRYQDLTNGRPGRDEAADAYIKDAREASEREQRRQQRQKPRQGLLVPGGDAPVYALEASR